jgi:hypothetical protein
MFLSEIYQRSPGAYQDISQDNSQTTLQSLRKTRLTLRMLNNLRRAGDAREKEKKDELALVRKMYAPPPAEEVPAA